MVDYSSVAKVAVMCSKHTNEGVFDGTTRPSSTEVGDLLDQVNDTINTMLAGEGFETPVTQTTVKSMLDGLAQAYTSDMVKATHSAGRFFTDKRLKNKNPMTVISDELAKWISARATGMEKLGATRNESLASGIGFRGEDDSGNIIEPMFQRDSFGNVVDT